jgi:hypothetical protein
VPAAGSGSAQTAGYTALGDSYAAEPLVPTQQPTPIGCLKSDHNHPHLVAGALPASLAAPLHPNALGMECVAQLVLAQLDPDNEFAQALCPAPAAAQPVFSAPRFTG